MDKAVVDSPWRDHGVEIVVLMDAIVFETGCATYQQSWAQDGMEFLVVVVEMDIHSSVLLLGVVDHDEVVMHKFQEEAFHTSDSNFPPF